VFRLLDTVNSPADLRRLSRRQLEQLAGELRDFIISGVSVTGGHLASNLGVIELTLALHTVFNSPEDKIIWDVGHQCYAHKILTGRREVFHTIRQMNGISGYPSREENEHDIFGTGHSSTSISAALGFAGARDCLGLDYSVVAVIGDGALSAGMAFEAMNHAGQAGTDLIVVLNDNEMSIAPNVGALSEYLNKLRMDPALQRAREDIKHLIKRLPGLGGSVYKMAGRLKESLKQLVVPGMLFEELGFTYFGPIDGHDIGSLQAALRDARARGGPVLVHVLTQKGKGYPPAENDPLRFHGTGPFDPDKMKHEQVPAADTYSDIFGSSLCSLAADNERIVAITAAMPDGTGLSDFARRYPARFFDVGIAEQHAVTLAGGLAAAGMRPVVAIYSTFLQRAYDQLIHDICLQNLPVVFAIDRAGIVGPDGATHQGIFDLTYLRAVPNLTVLCPRDASALRHMLARALEASGPVAIRYPRGECVDLPAQPGNGNRRRIDDLVCAEVLRSGHDLAIFGVGPVLGEAVKAAEELARRDFSCMVVDVRSVKPLDEEFLCDVASRIQRIITVEENVLNGGLSSSLLELFSRNRLSNVQVISLGIDDVFVKHGSRDELIRSYGLDANGIMKTAGELLVGMDARMEV